MNILQILPELNVGGVETGTVDLAKYLTQMNHRCIVVSHGGALVESLNNLGIKHYTLPVHKKNIFTAFYCVKKLVEIIKSEKIDIVHARSRVPAWIGYFATRQTEAHFVTTCHGYYSNGYFSRIMGYGKRVIAISQVIARHMVHDFQVPLDNIRIIPRSVDLSKFNVPRPQKQPTDPKVIVNVGRLTPLKGHTYFLKAMARLVRTYGPVKILIVGDAPASKAAYKQELLTLTKKLGLEQYVEFMGTRFDIPQILSQADCLVLSTTTQEAFGRVIIEAQAASVPVVATQVGGVTEVVDHEKTGLLVPPKDDLMMAQAVERMLKGDDFVKQCISEALKKIEDRYTLKHMADATIDVYQEVMRSTNILLIKLTALGDIVLSTAAFKAIRQRFPRAHIWCLTSVQGAALLESCADIDTTLVYDLSKKGVSDIWQMGALLRRFRFDKVVDLQNNRISHLLSALAMPKQSFGYDNGKLSFLLSHRIKNDIKNIPPVEHQFRILKKLGIDYSPQVRLALLPSQKDEAHIKQLLDSEWLGHAPVMVGINIAASEAWPSKNWPAQHISKLCDLLAALNMRVVLTGALKDRDLARQIIAKAKVRPANLVGKTTMLQLAALMKHLKVYISPDSAPLHVAASQGVACLALFGPTDPNRHLPPSDQITVLGKKVKCSPCYAGQCKIQTHDCLQGVHPDEVVMEIRKLIKV